jgi:hypothetical protein
MYVIKQKEEKKIKIKILIFQINKSVVRYQVKKLSVQI